MKKETVLYLSRQDVETVNLPMADIIGALDSMFKEKGEGRVEMPPKPGIHTQDNSFHYLFSSSSSGWANSQKDFFPEAKSVFQKLF